jgi:hypothetical protein
LYAYAFILPKVPVFGGRGVYESGFPISTAATAFHYVDFADLSGLRGLTAEAAAAAAFTDSRHIPRREAFGALGRALVRTPDSKLFGHLALL